MQGNDPLGSEHWQAWVGASLGAFACFVVFALLVPAGFGMGDVKLMLLLGAALGAAVLPGSCSERWPAASPRSSCSCASAAVLAARRFPTGRSSPSGPSP